MVDFNRRRTEARYPAAMAGPLRTVGIVGAGTMGMSIAAATTGSGLPVAITDTRPEALADLPDRMAAELAAEGDGPASEGPPPAVDSRLQTTGDLAEVARSDLVLETVVEDLWIKEPLLAKLEAGLGPKAVLASNTSTISIGRLSERLSEPERFCGIHFFLPVRLRRLVEIIRGPRSGDRALAAAVAYARTLGKIPLVVEDGPGFLVNRLMMMYLSDGLQLVAEGVPIEQVEHAATQFGMALGPMSLIDQIGLDVAVDCGWVLASGLGQSMVPSPLLVAMLKAGRLGRKSGKGFFCYREGRRVGPRQPDAELARLMDTWTAPAGRHEGPTVTARLVLPMLLEATRILAEGKVDDPRDVDLAVIFGFGFPAALGGLLYWADTLGAARIVDMLRPLAPLGPRAQPTPLLLELAAAGRRFYPDRQDEIAPPDGE